MPISKPAAVPPMIYGTAWKKEATSGLVETAALAGFRAIDTANQPRHYNEPQVGDAIETLAANGLPRQSFFLQTKFTPIDGQDHRVPYDRNLDVKDQVHQSFESSLEHLKTDYIDSYLLHGPYSHPGLGPEDWEVWSALEGIYEAGRVRMIGISNVNHFQLVELIDKAKVKPMVVQNRCFASRGWDCTVRNICSDYGIVYQGFSLLTANPKTVRHPAVFEIARRLGVESEQVIFRFAMQSGMTPLTGTTSERHMKDDLKVLNFELSAAEVDLIESIEG
jgi:diketogulonate reductase-like aldo/keto reductase